MGAINQSSEYSDLELEEQLKDLKKRSLADLLLLQGDIIEKYTHARDEYEEKRSTINAAKRKYYYRILIEVFLEIWRFACGKSTKRSTLREEKIKLRQKLAEEHQLYTEQITTLSHCLKELEERSELITVKEQELETLNEVIKNIELKLKNIESKEPTLYSKMKDQLHNHIAERDELSVRATELYKEIEGLINALADHFGHPLKQSHLVEQKVFLQQHLKKIKEIGQQVNHPVADKLSNHLSLRTETSFADLKKAMDEHPEYLESKQINDLIWEASKIDNRITKGMVREIELPSIKEIQQTYFEEVAKNLRDLEDQLEKLVQKRVESEILKTQKSNLLTQANDIYCTIVGIQMDYVDSTYIPRAKLQEINLSRAKEDFHKAKESRRMLKNELSTIEKDLSSVDHQIETIRNEIEICVVKPVLFTSEILHSLIKKCEKDVFHTNPITQALAKFLKYPTPTLLAKLKETIANHPNHLKEATPLLEDANKYYPYIQKNAARLAGGLNFFKTSDGEDDSEEVSSHRLSQ